jgi:hypothetical protein
MMSKGFIQHSKAPHGYPVIFVKKKDGSLHMCVDYRRLNEVTVWNDYPIPLQSMLTNQVKGAKHFTALDLHNGYHLLCIAKGNEWKTVFHTRYGQFEYKVMPFGLTNAPAAFQHLMNDLFKDLLDKRVVVYIDDILIYSKTLEEHQVLVKEVLKRLQENNLYAKPEKCDFHKSEIEFLGFAISGDGIAANKKKLQAICHRHGFTDPNMRRVLMAHGAGAGGLRTGADRHKDSECTEVECDSGVDEPHSVTSLAASGVQVVCGQVRGFDGRCKG